VVLRKQYSGRKNFGFFPMISGVFLQNPVTFPHLSCRIPPDLVAGIINLGSCETFANLGEKYSSSAF
jgi:hypothetical protein